MSTSYSTYILETWHEKEFYQPTPTHKNFKKMFGGGASDVQKIKIFL